MILLIRNIRDVKLKFSRSKIFTNRNVNILEIFITNYFKITWES